MGALGRLRAKLRVSARPWRAPKARIRSTSSVGDVLGLRISGQRGFGYRLPDIWTGVAASLSVGRTRGWGSVVKERLDWVGARTEFVEPPSAGTHGWLSDDGSWGCVLSLTSRGSRPTRLSSDGRRDAMFRVHVGEDEFVELGLADGTLVVDRSEGRELGSWMPSGRRAIRGPSARRASLSEHGGDSEPENNRDWHRDDQRPPNENLIHASHVS